MTRRKVRSIAKQYGFIIDDFIPWYSSKTEFHTFFHKGEFLWNEEDWFESVEHTHNYFKYWSNRIAIANDEATINGVNN